MEPLLADAVSPPNAVSPPRTASTPRYRDDRGADDAALARAHDQLVLSANAVWGLARLLVQDDGDDCAAGRDALLARLDEWLAPSSTR